jgi:hypothetical protein
MLQLYLCYIPSDAPGSVARVLHLEAAVHVRNICTHELVGKEKQFLLTWKRAHKLLPQRGTSLQLINSARQWGTRHSLNSIVCGRYFTKRLSFGVRCYSLVPTIDSNPRLMLVACQRFYNHGGCHHQDKSPRVCKPCSERWPGCAKQRTGSIRGDLEAGEELMERGLHHQACGCSPVGQLPAALFHPARVRQG